MSQQLLSQTMLPSFTDVNEQTDANTIVFKDDVVLSCMAGIVMGQGWKLVQRAVD